VVDGLGMRVWWSEAVRHRDAKFVAGQREIKWPFREHGLRLALE
jgi:hypothetical protein